MQVWLHEVLLKEGPPSDPGTSSSHSGHCQHERWCEISPFALTMSIMTLSAVENRRKVAGMAVFMALLTGQPTGKSRVTMTAANLKFCPFTYHQTQIMLSIVLRARGVLRKVSLPSPGHLNATYEKYRSASLLVSSPVPHSFWRRVICMIMYERLHIPPE